MYLGLDLRGGVHFLLQVDMKGALTKRSIRPPADLRTLMRDKNVRHGGIGREGDASSSASAMPKPATRPATVIADSQPDLLIADAGGHRLQDWSPR
jgi:preprotein translocase subunit SecD